MTLDEILASYKREKLTPYGKPEYGDNTQYYADRWGRMYYFDPETNKMVAAQDNSGNRQYADGRSVNDSTALYQKYGLGGPFNALSTSGANDYNLATEINGRLYIPSSREQYAPSWLDSLAPGVAEARKAVYDNIYTDAEGNEWSDPRLIYAADKLMSPYFERLAAKDDFLGKMGPLLATGAAFGGLGAFGDLFSTLTGAGGSTGGAALSAADIAGLTQMGIDAGLSGAALESFVASGGTLGSTAAGVGGFGSGFGGGGSTGGAALSAADIAGLTQMGIDAGLSGAALESFVASGGTLGSTAAGGALGGAADGLSTGVNFTGGTGLSQYLSGGIPGGSTSLVNGLLSLGYTPANIASAGLNISGLNMGGGTGVIPTTGFSSAASGSGGFLDLLGKIPLNAVGSLIGGLGGYLSGKDPQTTTSATDIPAWLRPYYTIGLDAGAQQLANSKDLTAEEKDTIAKMLQRLNAPNAGLEAANKTLTDTAAGKYLDLANNPQWQEAQRQIGTSYNETIRPGTDAAFSRSGAMGIGNSAWEEMTARNNRSLATGLGTAAAGLYGQERQNQLQAAGAMPGFQNQYLTGLGNAALQLGNYQRTQPWQGILNYGQLLGSTRGPSVTTTQQASNPWQSSIGGAMAGYVLGNLWSGSNNTNTNNSLASLWR